MVSDESECFKVDINEILRRYYIFDPSSTNNKARLEVNEENIEVQAIAYEKAVD